MKHPHSNHAASCPGTTTKRYVHLAVTVIFVCVLFPSARIIDPADRLLGRWYTKNNEAIFEFYRKGNEYCGRLEPLKYPDITDSLNPVDSLRSRKLSGATTIGGLRYNPEKRCWEDGWVYNPSNGKTYHCTCRLIGEGNLLKFRGFLGVSVLGQTQVWKRVEGK